METMLHEKKFWEIIQNKNEMKNIKKKMNFYIQ